MLFECVVEAEVVGETVVEGCVDAAALSLSRWAGLNRSIEMVSLRPLSEMVKCLSVREMTGNGPL